jgi:hypothetical protein
VTGTAALNAKANLGDCDPCVRNHLRGNPEIIAAWKHVRRIEKAPRRSGEAITPPSARELHRSESRFDQSNPPRQAGGTM